jgi:hypothetical protein
LSVQAILTLVIGLACLGLLFSWTKDAYLSLWATVIVTLWSLVTPGIQEVVKQRLVNMAGQRSAEITVCSADSMVRFDHANSEAAGPDWFPPHFRATITNNGAETLDHFVLKLVLGMGPPIYTFDLKIGLNSMSDLDKLSVKSIGNLYTASIDKLLPEESIHIDGWFEKQGEPMLDARADNLIKTSHEVRDCWPSGAVARLVNWMWPPQHQMVFVDETSHLAMSGWHSFRRPSDLASTPALSYPIP